MSELKLAVNYQWSDDKNQYQITSNWDDVISDCFDDNYVNFTGYFGKYGPEVFAAAPELYEALEWLEVYAKVQVERFPMAADSDGWKKVLSALAKARGER